MGPQRYDHKRVTTNTTKLHTNRNFLIAVLVMARGWKDEGKGAGDSKEGMKGKG